MLVALDVMCVCWFWIVVSDMFLIFTVKVFQTSGMWWFCLHPLGVNRIDSHRETSNAQLEELVISFTWEEDYDKEQVGICKNLLKFSKLQNIWIIWGLQAPVKSGLKNTYGIMDVLQPRTEMFGQVRDNSNSCQSPYVFLNQIIETDGLTQFLELNRSKPFHLKMALHHPSLSLHLLNRHQVLNPRVERTHLKIIPRKLFGGKE